MPDRKCSRKKGVLATAPRAAEERRPQITPSEKRRHRQSLRFVPLKAQFPPSPLSACYLSIGMCRPFSLAIFLAAVYPASPCLTVPVPGVIGNTLLGAP